MSEAAAPLAGAAALAAPPAAPDPAPAPDPALKVQADPASPDQPWYHSLPKDHHEFIANKKWDGPEAMLKSYQNLEQLLGADKAGKTVMLPDEKATPEQRAEFLAKVGLAPPEKVEDYGIKLEGELAEKAGYIPEILKEVGVPKDIGKGLIDKVMAREAENMKAWAVQSSAEANELATELGKDFDNKVELGRRAIKMAGLEAGDLGKLEMAIGTKRMMKMFMQFGENLAEASAPPPGQGGGQFSASPAQAKAKIDQLVGDPAFQARYMSPDPKVRQIAIEEMAEWQKKANPGS